MSYLEREYPALFLDNRFLRRSVVELCFQFTLCESHFDAFYRRMTQFLKKCCEYRRRKYLHEGVKEGLMINRNSPGVLARCQFKGLCPSSTIITTRPALIILSKLLFSSYKNPFCSLERSWFESGDNNIVEIPNRAYASRMKLSRWDQFPSPGYGIFTWNVHQSWLDRGMTAIDCAETALLSRFPLNFIFD